MVNYREQLDGIFQALSDPTRRAVVTRLARGAATVSELAKPFDMTLPSFLKHIRTLEDAGLLRSHKEGRVRTCVIDERSFEPIENWLERQRAVWEDRTDRLERLVTSTDEDDAHDFDGKP